MVFPRTLDQRNWVGIGRTRTEGGGRDEEGGSAFRAPNKKGRVSPKDLPQEKNIGREIVSASLLRKGREARTDTVPYIGGDKTSGKVQSSHIGVTEQKKRASIITPGS